MEYASQSQRIKYSVAKNKIIECQVITGLKRLYVAFHINCQFLTVTDTESQNVLQFNLKCSPTKNP